MTSFDAATFALKATLLLLLAGGASVLLRYASAAARHLALVTGLGAVLLLPLLAMTLPDWQVLGALAVPQGAAVLLPAPFERISTGNAEPMFLPMVATIWLIGVITALAWIVIGEARLRWRLRGSSSALSREWHETVALAAPAGGKVRFVECDWLESPCTWGVVRPVVLLPSNGRGWTAAERRYAVLHELAHVARGDLAANLVARLACAVYWYHPLAWLAARAAHRAREEACDDAVVQQQVSASDYASLLLTLGTRSRGADGALATTLGMARRSALGARVSALLDDRRDRAAVSPRGITMAVAIGAALAIGVATAAPAQQPRGVAKSGGSRAELMAAVAKRVCAERRPAQGKATYAVALRDSTGALSRYTLSVDCGREASK